VPESCRFDESVPRLLRVLHDELGRAQVENGVVLRDVTGRLSFFSRVAIDPVKRDAVVEKARVRLGRMHGRIASSWVPTSLAHGTCWTILVSSGCSRTSMSRIAMM